MNGVSWVKLIAMTTALNDITSLVYSFFAFDLTEKYMVEVLVFPCKEIDPGYFVGLAACITFDYHMTLVWRKALDEFHV